MAKGGKQRQADYRKRRSVWEREMELRVRALENHVFGTNEPFKRGVNHGVSRETVVEQVVEKGAISAGPSFDEWLKRVRG